MATSTDSHTNFFEEKLQFSSELDNIRYSEKIMDILLSKLTISEEIYGNILLSLSEAINNAIVHGNKFDTEKSVVVTYKYDGTYLIFEIIDEGEGFDPNTIKDPTDVKNLENLYGRGVFIIISLSDKVEFEYKKGQVVRMFFLIK